MKNSELTKSIALRCRGKLSEKRIKLRAVAAVLGVSVDKQIPRICDDLFEDVRRV